LLRDTRWFARAFQRGTDHVSSWAPPTWGEGLSGGRGPARGHRNLPDQERDFFTVERLAGLSTGLGGGPSRRPKQAHLHYGKKIRCTAATRGAWRSSVQQETGGAKARPAWVEVAGAGGAKFPPSFLHAALQFRAWGPCWAVRLQGGDCAFGPAAPSWSKGEARMGGFEHNNSLEPWGAQGRVHFGTF